MKKRIMIGVSLGTIAGILDVIPMVAQKLTWDANLSAFSLWIVIGFMLAISQLAAVLWIVMPKTPTTWSFSSRIASGLT
jgi:hypothetical protein